ncbi:4Fe-4S binding protein [Oceanomicrobium pacificus]|uniref:4Fe-4S dicluster domain-containing protein n=1 Tax=Oceanomicrobium pacificus TaxID=2692916 RepID=A0A6B0TUI1_9RHOB|nr:4Fe-4S binding protein [Oceanomicrobium pacificus]MXU66449.1 4Fe-4S dicluster domain-containing protein [Oceanomicrobium pacificus]
MARPILLCDCSGSQKLDRDRLADATGLCCSRIHSALCTTEIDRAEAAMVAASEAGEELMVACAQEARRFSDLAGDLGLPDPVFVDLRDRAGWTADAAGTVPKMAALIAEAQVPAPPDRTVEVQSAGLCLIIGPGDAVAPVAAWLAEHLAVTCLMTDDGDVLPPAHRTVEMHRGAVRSATGSLGGFFLTVSGFRAGDPSGRGPMRFDADPATVSTECDIIFDLTGGPPLFPAHEKRDGYLRADPARPAEIWAAAAEAATLKGTFDKTLHVELDPLICAHERAGQTGCTRCLSLCPTGAIRPDGDAVAIDPGICAGCGACAVACPSGAVSYAAPPVDHLFARLSALVGAAREAGLDRPRLLVHDAGDGRDWIALCARMGDGLPADLLPFAVEKLGLFGHAEAALAAALGCARIDLLDTGRGWPDHLVAELDLARAIIGDAVPVARIAPPDPVALPDHLGTAPDATGPAPQPVLALGDRRSVTRLAAQGLHADGAVLPLPQGAPYGAVLVDRDACTLCLACASLCPSAALSDNPDRPELRFQEAACLQCGICAAACPEQAITLEPRLATGADALGHAVLHGEDPAECIECGRAFGVQSTIDRIVAKLEGAHPMFAKSDQARLIRMCDDCRVTAQAHSDLQPFASAPRPRIRTTEDDLRERDAAKGPPPKLH